MSMRQKLSERLKLSAPARKIVLLPDTHFFCRAVPVTGDVPAEISAQVELALEALAPFPLAQMYHGYFWRPGAKNACVFAAYRKRFTAEQVEAWADAEAVLPSFAAMLGTRLEVPTTLLLWSEKSLTAVNWDDGNDAPVSVVARELPAEPTEADRASLRDAVLRESGAARTVIEPAAAPALDPASNGDIFIFQSDRTSAVFTREELDVLDVRDKEELAARRRSRARDLLLWRALLGCAAAIMLAACLELVMIGGSLWQKGRTAIMDMQEPMVAKLRMAKNLTTRIDERSTGRMRPFEMISMVGEKKPASITFINATVTSANLNALDVEAQAVMSSDVDLFRSALNQLPGCEKVEFKGSRLQNGLTTFRVVVSFRPEAFKSTP